MMSKENLLTEARAQAYKPEILEKVYRLLDTLEQLMQVSYLRERLVLKGGTALNLFHFDDIPRLSVDIDLNYIGQLEREEMLKERPIINDAIEKILIQNQFERYRSPNNYAGGKMIWRYPSVLGQKGNLEIDLNYMYREPLWPIQYQRSKFQNSRGFKFPVLDIHELAAGKLSALMNRTASRDLYDAHHLLLKSPLETEKLRFSFVVYLAITGLKPALLSPEMLQHDVLEIKNRLMPVLRQKNTPRSRRDIANWANTLKRELQEALLQVLPLSDNEIEFISMIRNSVKIDASIITDDPTLQNIVNNHPALKWAFKQKAN